MSDDKIAIEAISNALKEKALVVHQHKPDMYRAMIKGINKTLQDVPSKCPEDMEEFDFMMIEHVINRKNKRLADEWLAPRIPAIERMVAGIVEDAGIDTAPKERPPPNTERPYFPQQMPVKRGLDTPQAVTERPPKRNKALTTSSPLGPSGSGRSYPKPPETSNSHSSGAHSGALFSSYVAATSNQKTQFASPVAAQWPPRPTPPVAPSSAITPPHFEPALSAPTQRQIRESGPRGRRSRPNASSQAHSEPQSLDNPVAAACTQCKSSGQQCKAGPALLACTRCRERKVACSQVGQRKALLGRYWADFQAVTASSVESDSEDS
ncbi:hypothetical protein CYLTODRAFT_468553 [Cylindrobasidium torrendii FP15055 ss-10]|uniref:Zn(2)-C6 fungal-type domain-containing protein n=1 Tax=Cylindrobasidium torrendii FP15055 ss-10 TaxID=1314674 RepID=A0A0D7B2R8_9AGAR|nr:hypothetical protein CYLTODRAFT_468553 [Cylindrobasidium torrendii FP15055 ss-10]